jgi:hypothetical protein
MSDSLKTLFDLVRSKSKKYNETVKKPDGQAFWQPIKKLLDFAHPTDGAKWRKPPQAFTKKVMTAIPEFSTTGDGSVKIIELNHFVIQTVRIPTTEKLTIKKIVQIALNIGQFQGRKSPAGLSKYMSGRTKLDTYITKTDAAKLSKHIPDRVVESLKKYLSRV